MTLLTEMSLGLAPLIVQQMFEIVHKIAESGITVLLVEQQIQRALQVAHTAYILESGSTVLSGATADLSRHEHVKRVYLGM